MRIIILSFLVLSSIVSNAQEYGSFTDTRDRRIYKSVKIGPQIWMAENLNVDKFQNGDPIPEAKTNEEWEQAGKNKKPAWCYQNNDPIIGIKYGRLYNWYAVNDSRGLAPEGWHIPSDEEWSELVDFLNGYEKAGKKMKSTKGWNYNGNCTNSSGFTAIPGGDRKEDGTYSDIGDDGSWWSSTKNATGYPWYRNLHYAQCGYVERGYAYMEIGISVRCIKD